MMDAISLTTYNDFHQKNSLVRFVYKGLLDGLVLSAFLVKMLCTVLICDWQKTNADLLS